MVWTSVLLSELLICARSIHLHSVCTSEHSLNHPLSLCDYHCVREKVFTWLNGAWRGIYLLTITLSFCLFCSKSHHFCLRRSWSSEIVHLKSNKRVGLHLSFYWVSHKKWAIPLFLPVFFPFSIQEEIQSQKALSHNFSILAAVLLLPAREICPENLTQGRSRMGQLPHSPSPCLVFWKCFLGVELLV